MISTSSVINVLHEHRQDKLALVCLLSLMGTEDGTVKSAADKLEELLPAMKDQLQGSKGARQRLAARVYDIAEDIYPWLREVEKKAAA